MCFDGDIIDISSDGGALNEGWIEVYNGGALLSYGTNNADFSVSNNRADVLIGRC